MFEVEAKVPLSKTDFKRLKSELPKNYKRVGEHTNKDRYYDVPKAYFLRIREKGNKASLDFKVKKRKGGVEMNTEVEWPIGDAGKMDKLLKKLGLNLWMQKEKESEYFKKGEITIELNRVPGLGHYLEIEILTESESTIAEATKTLEKMFKKFGFSKKDYEPKYYLELLEEKRKNKTLN